MAKKPNYDFEKRKKELDRKKKKDDKRAERLLRRQEGSGGEPEDAESPSAEEGEPGA